jgi:hypothetical protein
MRPELAKDDLGIDESTGLHVLVRIAQSPMPIHKDFVKDGGDRLAVYVELQDVVAVEHWSGLVAGRPAPAGESSYSWPDDAKGHLAAHHPWPDGSVLLVVLQADHRIRLATNQPHSDLAVRPLLWSLTHLATDTYSLRLLQIQ